MGLIQSLKRLVDPNRHRIEDARRKRAVEVVFKEDGAPPPPEAVKTCAHCGRSGEQEWCADCLTFSMK